MKSNKKEPMLRVPYALSVHDRQETVAVSRVIDEHRTALGVETRSFEKDVAKLFGKKYGIMVNSGSSANLLALEILDLPRGSEVITPILTFNTTLAPILQKGLVPVFVNAKPRAYLADIDEIERKITQKTRALMIPSLIGNIPDLPRLATLAKKHNLFFIEDSCDTLGGTFKGKPTGRFSHISTTSFYGSHVINAASGGGMICVNDRKWRDRLLMLRGWGRTSALFADSEKFSERFKMKLVGAPYDGKFIFSEIGYNFLPLEVSAAFGRVQLKKFPKFAKTRQANFADLLKYFKKWDKYFELPLQTPHTRTNWIAFPLMIKKGAPFSRIEIVRFLEAQNIQTRPVFSGNILRQPAYTRLSKSINPSNFPFADQVMKNAFVVGCHHGLTAKHMNRLKQVFDEFLKAL